MIQWVGETLFATTVLMLLILAIRPFGPFWRARSLSALAGPCTADDIAAAPCRYVRRSGSSGSGCGGCTGGVFIPFPPVSLRYRGWHRLADLIPYDLAGRCGPLFWPTLVVLCTILAEHSCRRASSVRGGSNPGDCKFRCFITDCTRCFRQIRGCPQGFCLPV